VLFFDHLPDRLPDWLNDLVGRVVLIEQQLFEAADSEQRWFRRT